MLISLCRAGKQIGSLVHNISYIIGVLAVELLLAAV